eukprot:238609_1
MRDEYRHTKRYATDSSSDTNSSSDTDSSSKGRRRKIMRFKAKQEDASRERLEKERMKEKEEDEMLNDSEADISDSFFEGYQLPDELRQFVQHAANGQLFIVHTNIKPQKRLVKVLFDNTWKPKQILW